MSLIIIDTPGGKIFISEQNVEYYYIKYINYPNAQNLYFNSHNIILASVISGTKCNDLGN